MSQTIYDNKSGSVNVSSYVGPETTETVSRTRFQITVVSDLDGRHHAASLNAQEIYDLYLALKRRLR